MAEPTQDVQFISQAPCGCYYSKSLQRSEQQWGKMKRWKFCTPIYRVLNSANGLTLSSRRLCPCKKTCKKSVDQLNGAGQNAKRQFRGLLLIRPACMVIFKDWSGRHWQPSHPSLQAINGSSRASSRCGKRTRPIELKLAQVSPIISFFLPFSLIFSRNRPNRSI